MPDLLERLRNRGWRLTAQRRVIAESLAGAHVHLSADEVHATASARLPEISRATVYNTLNELVALGELQEVQLGARARRYDPNVEAAHHHLVCERCGAVVDVESDHEPRPLGPAAKGYVVDRVEVVYRGRCERCRRRGAGQPISR